MLILNTYNVTLIGGSCVRSTGSDIVNIFKVKCRRDPDDPWVSGIYVRLER